ncbi:recombinase family protein [Actinomyces viscosus]|uniref:Recombinase family protein n=1 Tax=Actinomyces viscosus TaxID=1656 RepID=A0ABT7TY89_ACTVI|nr:recombinase family protein [Actinomyces viscosus]MDM8076756.1 recombinase family protein [Actinomyces viscosus]
MTTQTTTNTPDEPHEPAAVLEEVPTTALDGQTGTGAIAIFYGAARYPFELARQRDLVADYAEATGLNLVTEFHDRQQRQYGLSMLLEACQRGGVEYVITASWPTPNLTTTEADAVTEQLAQAGTHLVCLNAWHPGDGTPPAWWNDEEGAQIRQLDALREHDRRQREQASQSSDVSEDNEVGEGSDASELTQTETTDLSKEVHHA